MRKRLCPVLCGLAVVLSGCSNITASDNTVAGIRAAGEDIVANLEAARFKHACEDLTAQTRSDISVDRGGCVGALAFARGLLALEGYPRLGQLVKAQVDAIVKHVDVEGIRGLVGGRIEVLYENGRWRFEGGRVAALAATPRFRSALAKSLQQLEGAGIGSLVEAARSGG